MNEQIDIFGWLNAVDQGHEDEESVWRVWHRMVHAQRGHDQSGVETARHTFEAMAESRNQPWLGVFGRHWEHQFRLNHLREGEAALGAVVSAFEAAHRPENADCPQSVCTVQDLCIVFSNVDGPAYAAETLAAAKDGLARIDSSWPCWDCLSTELITGLEYAKRFGEAVDKVAEVEVELRSLGALPSVSYARRRLELLLADGRAEEALAFDNNLVRQRYNPHTQLDWPRYELVRARVLLAAGRDAEAVTILDDADDPLETPLLGLAWRNLSVELVNASAIPNSDANSATLVRLAHYLYGRGSWRDTFETAHSAAVLAANRGAIRSAHRGLAFCESVVPKLRAPLDAPDRLADLRQAIDAAPATIDESAPLDQQVEDIEREMADDFDAEKFAQLAMLLGAQGWQTEATKLLWERIEAHPDEEMTAFTLMAHLLSSDRNLEAEMQRLASLVEPHSAANADWIRANLYAKHEQWIECADCCASVVEADPEVVNTRRLWAGALRELGDWPAAARVSAEILALGTPLEAETTTQPEAAADASSHAMISRKRDLWSALVLGTAAQDWGLVRATSAELGLALSTETGEVIEPWERVRIRFADDDGVERTHVAQRTGPATATVQQVAPSVWPQHYLDRIVFEPAPLNEIPPDASEDDLTHFMYEYRVVTMVETGGHRSFMVSGVVPDDSDEVWRAWRDELHEAGFGVWSYGGWSEHFRPSGEERSALYAAIGAPASRAPRELHELLTQSTSTWEHKPAWPELARAAGAADADEHQVRVDTMWGEPDAD